MKLKKQKAYEYGGVPVFRFVLNVSGAKVEEAGLEGGEEMEIIEAKDGKITFKKKEE